MDVRDKVVVIVGGASGLGRAACEHFDEHGAQIAVMDRNPRAAREVASAVRRGIPIELDITDCEAVESAIAQTMDYFGQINVNLNTAGIPDGAKIVSRGKPAPSDHFDKVIAVNLIGTFNVMRLAVAAMLRNEPENGERGVVINTASIAAFDGQIGQAAYSASKAGIVGMTLPVARDLAGQGVRVNTIAPGLFSTPMAAALQPRVSAGLERWLTEPCRWGRPDEFAWLARHIVENSYLNGECIRLDAAIRPSLTNEEHR